MKYPTGEKSTRSKGDRLISAPGHDLAPALRIGRVSVAHRTLALHLVCWLASTIQRMSAAGDHRLGGFNRSRAGLAHPPTWTCHTTWTGRRPPRTMTSNQSVGDWLCGRSETEWRAVADQYVNWFAVPPVPLFPPVVVVTSTVYTRPEVPPPVIANGQLR